MTIENKIKLLDGNSIPQLGFGTYLSEPDDCYNSVLCALECGYRHIDTAAFYQNEDAVGRAVRDSGLNREDIFVTTKLWNDDQGYDKTMKAFEKSYKALNLNYIDLYLIHWPIPKGREKDYAQLNDGTWKAFNELKAQGLIRSLGVSNFLPEHIERLYNASGVMPVINQIELHPSLPQWEIVEYCKEKNIAVEAWRPILKGEADSVPQLVEVAKKHGVTPTQVCLRWELQRGIIPLPKSVTPSRIKQNADLFGFSLDEEDMQKIASITQKRYGFHPLSFGVRK